MLPVDVSAAGNIVTAEIEAVQQVARAGGPAMFRAAKHIATPVSQAATSGRRLPAPARVRLAALVQRRRYIDAARSAREYPTHARKRLVRHQLART